MAHKKVRGVYVLRNVITGRSYVGSSNSIYHRIDQHFYDLRRGQHVSRTMQTDFDNYGRPSFDWIILSTVSDDTIIEQEQHWMDIIHPDYNTNKVAGKSIEGYARTREAIDKREATKRANFLAGKRKQRDPSTWLRGEANPSYGKPKSPETREKIRKSVSGERNPNYGKPRDAETRRKISESNSKTYPGLVDPNGKVYKNIRFLTTFCEQHGLGLSSVVAVMNGRQRHHKGWTLYDPSVIT